MKTIEREELISKYPRMFGIISLAHMPDEDVHKVLFIDNNAILGDSFKRGYFKIMGGNYLHYHVEYTVVDVEHHGVALHLLKVHLYETYSEYEADRIRTLGALPHDQQVGLNLN